MKFQITEHDSEGKSYSHGAIGIDTIYEALDRKIREVEDDRVLHYSSGIGIGWGMSGGELAGLDRKGISVSGLHETIQYLEKVEMGLLRDIDYLECRVCKEGCIGGPSTVAARYQTKNLVRKFVRMFGVEKRIKYEYTIKLYKEGWFFSKKIRTPMESRLSKLTISERIERQNRVEDTLRLLPRWECGVCGSPDCRTFAEDVVDGRAVLEDCVCLRLNKKSGGASEVKRDPK